MKIGNIKKNKSFTKGLNGIRNTRKGGKRSTSNKGIIRKRGKTKNSKLHNINEKNNKMKTAKRGFISKKGEVTKDEKKMIIKGSKKNSVVLKSGNKNKEKCKYSSQNEEQNNPKRRYAWLFDKVKKKKKDQTFGSDSVSSNGSSRHSGSEDPGDTPSSEGKRTKYINQNTKKKFVLYKKRKNKKKNKVILSCFQNLGLSEKMCRSISSNLKYNRPTDIQKLCIPKILNRKDIICISKTGSGKSLVYLSTLIDLLGEHSKFFGIRGVIILPTKELVIQIYKLARKICMNYFNLKINIIIGGVSLIKQFDLLKENLDIVICTPGRLSFILEETKLSLEKVEILIIDEADRLLELNYYNDMNNIYKNLHTSFKQTLLISATLPTNVENYFRLKLNNPEVLFVNSDNVISDQLKLHFLFCRSYEKYAVLIKLIFLCKNKKLGKTMIFFCTKYHILFFSKIFNYIKIPHATLYGNSDTSFRIQQINNFTRNNNIQFLLVTDLASRGINITTVQNIINYNLPYSPKLFIHRVGRACRNNLTGYGISLVTYQDILYAYEICFFIGKKLKFYRGDGQCPLGGEDFVNQKETNEVGLSEADVMVPDKKDTVGFSETVVVVAGETDVTVPCETDVAVPGETDVAVPGKTDIIGLSETYLVAPDETDVVVPDETDAVVPDETDAVVPDETDAVIQGERDETKPGEEDNKNHVYIGALNNIGDYIEFIDNLKKDDSELVSLNKSMQASYKLYYSMRPKVSKYASTKCVNKIKKIGGLYKLCLIYHPDELYRNTSNNENELTNKYENSTNLSLLKGGGSVFNNLIKFPENYNKQESTQEISNNENENNEYVRDKLLNVQGGSPSHYRESEKMNHTHKDVISFLHNFQNSKSSNSNRKSNISSNDKAKSISEVVKEKLNKLKEKTKRYKNRKYDSISNDVNELMDSFSFGLSADECDNETSEKWKSNILFNCEEKYDINKEEKKKGKLSKRALKKMLKGQKGEAVSNTIEQVTRKKEEISLDDILKKINQKKMKTDTSAMFDLKTPGFDLLPDEEDELKKQRFIKKQVWDKKKKKFVLREIDTFQGNAITSMDKNNGKKINISTVNNNNSVKSSTAVGIYQKWVKRTKNRINNIGELEEDNKIRDRFKSRQTKNNEKNDKERNIEMLELTHPEITESLSKNIKLTKKQQRLYKKYITGKYDTSTSNILNAPQLKEKKKKSVLQNKIRTDRNFRVKYVRARKKKHERKLKEKYNLKSARSRSLAIIKKKKISK
ncbi:ATP-dependent RNA helicase DBP10, putative (DBP10) [Plasmodium malariae]|uniref:RNA helicase n=1 Tax=Plasmodium malariae TaxID=5858 RepID=A0A1A8VQH7_PLAMA|nr:ATP-dependent RNA helicase DBP10, putative (DBP10) [Plasmodium malariae]